jgi:hypothetical protein
MGPYLVDLAAAVLMLAVLYARPVVVVGVLIGTVILVPATLVAPHLHTSYATVDHLVIAAAGLRVISLVRRGVMARTRLRATPVHLALALLVAAWGIAGIVFAPRTEVSATAELRMVNLAFTVAFFVVTLAFCREIDDPWLVMKMLTATLAVTVVIAVIEHITQDAFGHWLFDAAGHPGSTNAAQVLETRAGHVRVRASSEFALAYAWVAVMLLPVATLVALRMSTRRLVQVGVPLVGLLLLAIFWTYSRSAAAAVPAVFILLAIAVRDRRTLVVGGLTALAALVLYAADPTIHHHLSLSTDQGSVGIRFQRLPPILAAVSHHPYLGLGLGGLQSISVTTTDNFYLSAYAETGAVGAAVLVALCATALSQLARGLFVVDSVRRRVVAASILGFVAFLVSGLFDDALLLGQPSQVAMLLLALGTATAEPELGLMRLPSWSTPRVVVMTAAGALLGLVVYLVAPVVSSQERVFTTVSPLGIVNSGGIGVGPSLIKTICDIANGVKTTLPDTHVDCRDNYTGPGLGTLRIETPSTSQTLRAYAAVKTAADHVYYLADYEAIPAGPPISARATAWQTAPEAGATLGFALAFIAPLPLRRRRRRDDPAPAEPGDVARPPAPEADPASSPATERLRQPRPVIPALDP